MFQNRGPSGHSLMVELSKSYFQKIECRVIMEAFNYKIGPETFKRFVDDSRARFQERSYADKFLEILDKQDPAIKYTVEFEDHKHSLNFSDINISNNTSNKKHEFEVHRKDAMTNMHIKSDSCRNPKILYRVPYIISLINPNIKSFFKGFLHRDNMLKKIHQGINRVFNRHDCREWT